MKWTHAAVLAVAVLLGSAPAGASAPSHCNDLIAPQPTTPLPPRPPAWASLPPGAQVARTTVHVTCTREGWPKCAFTGEIAFALPGGEPQTAAGAGEITFTGGRTSEHGSGGGGCGGEPDRPIFLRHYWVASTGSTYTATVDVGSGLDGPVDVTVSAPPELSVKLALDGPGTPVESDAVHADKRGASQAVRLRRTIAASPLRAGGPFFAAGAWGGLDRGPKTGWHPKIRAGYEMAAPWWLIESLATETDFRSVTLVPAVEAAISGNWAQVVAIGVGAPVHLVDRNTVGFRGQMAIQWPVIGFVGTVDYFPVMPAGSKAQMSLLGQISF